MIITILIIIIVISLVLIIEAFKNNKFQEKQRLKTIRKDFNGAN